MWSMWSSWIFTGIMDSVFLKNHMNHGYQI